MTEPRYYMACLDLRSRDCVVVGGGRVGAEKAEGLLACGADVTVIAPQLDPAVHELDVRLVRRAFTPTDLTGRFLVIAATNDRAVNAEVSAAAAERNMFCNVADDPDLCSFILPAVVRRDPIVVGVSSGGASPALAKRLRDEISRLIGPEHVELAHRLRSLRPRAKRELPTYEARRDYFERLVEEALG
jgi:precorrin-2 dehydrogenase / sirohydrochlorin ferrochelatase